MAAPDPAWVALLRHGSSEVPPDQRNRRETELQDWCWSALLEGDGRPWMSLGAVLFSRAERVRWIPVLGAVDSDGTLHLPPFLAELVPDTIRTLPSGWWEFLLRSMDGRGRLLPVGAPPAELPWTDLLSQGAAAFEALVLVDLPPVLGVLEGTPWLHALPSGGRMVDPRLRAWARGLGPCAAGLDPLAGAGLAFGDRPTPLQERILQGKSPEEHALPLRWLQAIQGDLATQAVAAPDGPCGDPTLDRLAMRWGLAPAAQSPGYPAWGEAAHPCADPFHWMAEGFRAFHAQDMEGALRAFTWAHAHFRRLDSAFWADRAAANARQAALFWGDLPAALRWQALQSEPPSPFKELDAALLCILREEWDSAVPMLERLCADHPDFEQAWYFLGAHGLSVGHRDWVESALAHSKHPGTRQLFQAFLEGFPESPPEELDPELALIWWFHLAKRDESARTEFWRRWGTWPNQPLRLHLGLALLELLPGERSAERLLELQVLADRALSPRHQARLQPLWPPLEVTAKATPAELLREALSRRPHPGWITWGPTEAPEVMGHGAQPPEGALSRLHRDGGLAPFAHGGWLWRGLPLSWEGAVVGHALAADPLEAAPRAGPELQILAPWVAKLLPTSLPEAAPEAGSLLTDGSEPMATLLRELARVAPSELSILVLGATGSGKELTAREIHRRSGRTGPLVAVNCSAFAETLLESELFGHVKGAFTGADRDRRGAIEAADKGTLFLDEVADLSPRLQSLFLRVLQEREVRRVGSDRAIHVDVRFLAATHRPLEQLAETGLFRRDLLFRLQGSVLHLPSLRERRHEFPYLVPRLLAQVAREAKRPLPELAPGLALALSRLPWLGNFRELRHALERALLRCGPEPMKPEHFPELQVPEAKERNWVDSNRAFQKRLLLETLRRHRFQVTEAAETLGITRPTLYIAARRAGLDLIAARQAWESGRD